MAWKMREMVGAGAVPVRRHQDSSQVVAAHRHLMTVQSNLSVISRMLRVGTVRRALSELPNARSQDILDFGQVTTPRVACQPQPHWAG